MQRRSFAYACIYSAYMCREQKPLISGRAKAPPYHMPRAHSQHRCDLPTTYTQHLLERAVTNTARIQLPWIWSFECCVRKMSCSMSTLRLRFLAESTLYVARWSPLKSASSPCAPFKCGSPVMPEDAAGGEGTAAAYTI